MKVSFFLGVFTHLLRVFVHLLVCPSVFQLLVLFLGYNNYREWSGYDK